MPGIRKWLSFGDAHYLTYELDVCLYAHASLARYTEGTHYKH